MQASREFMKPLLRVYFILPILLFFQPAEAQEGIPVYYDYLTDNLTLLHPALAGASRCGKARLTGRMQWSGVKDFPMLQTLSINSHLGKRSGFGMVLYNDRNGYHHRKGMEFSFAHHLQLSQGAAFNQLSFGITALYSLNNIDYSEFDTSTGDPVLNRITGTGNYYNVHVGMAWHVQHFFIILTAKNLLNIPRPLYSETLENSNLRHYLVHTGYFFGKRQGFHFEPSLLVQYREFSGDLIGDANAKFYYDLPNGGAFFAGVSYRNYFESAATQSLQDITPLAGVFWGRWMIAYVYTHQLSETTFSQGGFHQITLGVNFDCRERVAHYPCPHLN